MMALQEWAYTGYVEVPSKDYALSDRKWTRELLWIISGAEGGYYGMDRLNISQDNYMRYRTHITDNTMVNIN